MSEIESITEEKIVLRLGQVKEKLASRISTLQTQMASRGVYHSSMHVQGVAEECCTAIAEAAAIISEELHWWLRQVFFLTEGKSQHIISFGNKQLARIDPIIEGYIAKAATIMPTGQLPQVINTAIANAKAQAESNISLSVRQWRIEHKRSALLSVGTWLSSALRRLVGLG